MSRSPAARELAEEYQRYHDSSAMTAIARAAHGDAYLGQTSSATYDDVVEAVNRTALEAGDRVIDAGCGNGCFATALAANHGVEVWGMDISEPLVQVAQASASALGVGDRCHFWVGDLGDLRPVPAPAKVVLAVGSLYWGVDIGAVVGAWVERIDRGGSVIVLSNLEREPLTAEEHEHVQNTSFLREGEVITALRAHGLSVAIVDETDRYERWLERWCAAMAEHTEALAGEVGPERAHGMVRRFGTYLSLANERKVVRLVLVATLAPDSTTR